MCEQFEMQKVAYKSLFVLSYSNKLFYTSKVMKLAWKRFLDPDNTYNNLFQDKYNQPRT